MRYFPCSVPFCLFFAILATLCYDVPMKKNLLALFVGIILASTTVPSLVLAQETPAQVQDTTQQPTSLLPSDAATGIPDGYSIDCIRFLKRPELRKEVSGDITIKGNDTTKKISFLDAKGKVVTDKTKLSSFSISARGTALSCGIKTGRIDMWLIPYYLVRVIDFGLLLAGLLSVLFIIIGGYHMIIGSYTEDKEKGKKTILYALGGLVLCLLAYTIVNLILLFVTA